MEAHNVKSFQKTIYQQKGSLTPFFIVKIQQKMCKNFVNILDFIKLVCYNNSNDFGRSSIDDQDKWRNCNYKNANKVGGEKSYEHN